MMDMFRERNNKSNLMRVSDVQFLLTDPTIRKSCKNIARQQSTYALEKQSALPEVSAGFWKSFLDVMGIRLSGLHSYHYFRFCRRDDVGGSLTVDWQSSSQSNCVVFSLNTSRSQLRRLRNRAAPAGAGAAA